jgi:hypothetical protein
MNTRIKTQLGGSLLTLLLLIFANLATASTPPNGPSHIYKEWNMEIETNDHIEIFTRVVKCSLNGPNQVHLKFFNENPVPKSVKFKVEITNVSTQNSFSKEILINADLGAMYTPDCSVNDPILNSLMIDLPNGYNPNNLSFSITIL